MNLRSCVLPALVSGALLLSACGGGGGSPGGGGTAALKGAVVLRDGTTQNLGGIQIRDMRTGLFTFTAANGSFDLGQVPVGTVSLQIHDPAVRKAQAPGSGDTAGSGADDGAEDAGGGADDPPGHDDADAHGDDGDADEDPDHDLQDDSADDGDDDDTGDDDCDLSGVDADDTVEVEIEIEHGTIAAVRFAQTRFDRQRSEVRLERAPSSDDADVEGKARLESRSDRQRFDVEVEDAAVGRSLELFVIDLDGVSESQGLRVADAMGESEWELRSNDGDRLPFGVTAVAALEGFGLEVRDGGTGLLLLTGTLSSLPPAADPASGGGGGDDGIDEERGRGRLVAAAGIAGEAHVELRSRPEDDRERFQVEIDHQGAPLSVKVWLAHPTSSVLTLIGTLSVGAQGEGEFELDTHDGDTLPFAVAGVAELVGLAVELRDAAGGTLLFSGITPSLVGH